MLLSVGEAAVTVTPFRAEDARTMQLSERSALSLQGIENLETVWRQYETMGPAWTLRVDGQIVGCAGLMFMWPTPARVAHAWLLPSPALGQYPLTVVKAIVGQFEALLAEYPLTRVQLEVQADYLIGHRFVQWLGFTREQDGIARRYGPDDQDFVRYEMVRPR